MAPATTAAHFEPARSARRPTLRRVPDPTPLRPPRLNAVGFCVYCDERHCEDSHCLARHETADWQICIRCDGSGYDRAAEQCCNCDSGMMDMTASVRPERPRPRPARLSFGGWCMWCLERWCISPDCIDRHARSSWEVCEDCDGRGDDDGFPCNCIYGLMETNFTGTTRQ